MSEWQDAPTPEDAEQMMECISNAIYGMEDHTTDPDRPFGGQPHTDQGKRGRAMVSGLCFRDVCDCFVLGWLHADGRSGLAESGTATYNDIYGEAPIGDIDPLAVMQNMMCEMEKRMGIYPNLPTPTGADE